MNKVKFDLAEWRGDFVLDDFNFGTAADDRVTFLRVGPIDELVALDEAYAKARQVEGIVRQHPAIHPQRTVVLLDDLRLHGDAYYLADPPAAERTYGFEEALTFFRRMAAGNLSSTVFEAGNGLATTQFICGFLGCDLWPFNPVLSALPRLLRVRPTTQTGDGLPHLIAFAMHELRERRSGGQVVKLRMAELLFVDVIRRHLETLPGEKVGWLAGLRNPLVARALALLHDAPAQSWTLDALAAQAGTSRSVLAERFVHFIGQPPMQYLRQLRMQLASRLLVEDGAKVVSVAAAVGFESEAAFSRAFKKCVGLSPDEWRRRRGE